MEILNELIYLYLQINLFLTLRIGVWESTGKF